VRDNRRMSFSRRNLLESTLAAPWISLAQKKTGKTNVLMFAVDDLNTRIGCYGDPLVKTPNLDRLARHGIRFERAYCNYPLCNPSRTVLLSGKRPETTRVHDNTLLPRTYLGRDAVFLPEYFKAHGYFTARVGKVAHFEKDVHWDISEEDLPTQMPDDMRKKMQARFGMQQGRPGGPPEPRPLTGGIGGMPWRATDNPDEKEPDGDTARRIVRLIGQHKDEPFFIACGFRKPHTPLFAPRKYFDMYRLEDIHLPHTPADDRDDIPPLALICTNKDNLHSDEERRQVTLAYHACTTFMDAQLGLVLDAMDQHKLWDNTVVILWADHGWHLYDHLQLWGKITQFEEAAHVPLMIHAPGKLAGAASQRLVEWIDIYPTLTELCGLPPAPGLDGSSLVPLLSDPRRPWKKAAYTMNWRGGDKYGRGLRTDRYRYTEWSEGRDGTELYDHETDPHEWTNLAGKAKVADVQKELQNLLRHGQKTNLPPRS
jgi:iduronate 2-sulfatase